MKAQRVSPLKQRTLETAILFRQIWLKPFQKKIEKVMIKTAEKRVNQS